jgi:hypothetical protein
MKHYRLCGLNIRNVFAEVLLRLKVRGQDFSQGLSPWLADV